MSTSPRVTRRGLFGLLGALSATPVIAAPSQPRDVGIGGTGYAPTTSGGEDRGIGGTGFIGTIQRFGSIVVNDVRISYPPGASVRIDGEMRRTRDLRIGHVVRVVARPGRDSLSTAAIEVESEVVGPILALSGDMLDVMGQSVDIRGLPRAFWWRKGAWAAVSGLRRTDGVIVASLVEPRPAGTARVAGILERDADGFWIGRLKLTGVDEAALGRRVIVAGRLTRAGLTPARLTLDRAPVQAGSVDLLSIETYLRADGDRLRLGSGLAIRNAAFTALAAGREVRAIVDARLDADGELRAESIRVSDSGGDGGGRGPGAGPAPGSGPAPGGGPPGGPGQGPGGPGSGPGGGPGGGPGNGPGGGSDGGPSGGPGGSSGAGPGAGGGGGGPGGGADGGAGGGAGGSNMGSP